jgi:short-subunit dehydrogenase involved in D-alanine esterification of teichoic acids
MAVELIKRGKKVLLAGRTEESLKATTSEIGAAGYYLLDVGDTSSLAGFVSKITSEHPELDCIINNAGVQRPLQIFGPDYDFDLKKADQEIDIDIRGPMHLSVLLIREHFDKKEKGGVVMNVSSVLGFVPFSVVNPVYNGAKAWLHFFTTNLRTQVKQAGKEKIRIVEIVPPAVESDLHRERVDPDDNKRHKGNKIALTQDEFMDEVRKGWEEGQETITAGPGNEIVSEWDSTMGKRYEKMTSS